MKRQFVAFGPTRARLGLASWGRFAITPSFPSGGTAYDAALCSSLLSKPTLCDLAPRASLFLSALCSLARRPSTRRQRPTTTLLFGWLTLLLLSWFLRVRFSVDSWRRALAHPVCGLSTPGVHRSAKTQGAPLTVRYTKFARFVHRLPCPFIPPVSRQPLPPPSYPRIRTGAFSSSFFRSAFSALFLLLLLSATLSFKSWACSICSPFLFFLPSQ